MKINKDLFGSHSTDPRCKIMSMLISYFPNLVMTRNGIAEDLNKEQDLEKKATYASQLAFVEFYLHLFTEIILVEKYWLETIESKYMPTILKEAKEVYKVVSESQQDFRNRFEAAARQGDIEQ